MSHRAHPTVEDVPKEEEEEEEEEVESEDVLSTDDDVDTTDADSLRGLTRYSISYRTSGDRTIGTQTMPLI